MKHTKSCTETYNAAEGNYECDGECNGPAKADPQVSVLSAAEVDEHALCIPGSAMRLDEARTFVRDLAALVQRRAEEQACKDVCNPCRIGLPLIVTAEGYFHEVGKFKNAIHAKCRHLRIGRAIREGGSDGR